MTTDHESTVRVRTHLGTVVGVRRAGVARFLGVPYAAALRGAERFAPPRAATPWTDDLPALGAGPSAPQPGSVRARLVLGDSPPSGDACLVLNVWTPDSAANLPVLCWVHGGGFTNGSGAVAALDGARLAAAGIVVVTVNYRLGALGFAHHPDLTGESSDRGLEDVAAALAWVQQSIAAFGGDPEQVTLAGDSAGGMCAGLLLAADPDLPIARLALHSGVPAVAPPAMSVERVERLAEVLGVQVGELADVESSRLVAAATRLGPAGRFVPTATGRLERPLDELIAAGPGRPTLITTNADEGTFFLVDERSPRPFTEEEAVRELDATCGDGAGRYRAALAATAEAPVGGSTEPHRVFARAYAQARFVEPADRWSDAVSRRMPVWRARYDRPSTMWDGWLGATHTLDVPLTFGTHRTASLARLYAGDDAVDAVAAGLQSHVVRFLQGKSPRPDWPTWLPDRPHVEALGTVRPDVTEE